MSADFGCAVQAVAFADDPIVVEAVEQVPVVEGHRRLEFGKIIVSCVRLEGFYVKPYVDLGIEPHGVRIAGDRFWFGKAAADVPQGGGEGAAGLAFRAVASEQPGQPLVGLRVLPV